MSTLMPTDSWIHGKAIVAACTAAFVICVAVIGLTFAIKVMLIALAILLFACSITALVVSVVFGIFDARNQRAQTERDRNRGGGSLTIRSGTGAGV